MKAGPFMLRIFVPEGTYDGMRLIDRLNWSGLGVMVPRERWAETRHRSELARPGVYILTGASRDAGRPRVYIGQAESIRTRLDAHCQTKDFWDWAYIFTTKSDTLNRAHIVWLEHALVERAARARACHLENGKAPMQPELTEAELSEMRAFLSEILTILALVGVTAFAPRGNVAALSPARSAAARGAVRDGGSDAAPAPIEEDCGADEPGEERPHGMDTLVVPAHAGGFENVFLGQRCWHAVRIAEAMRPQIRYLAIYRTQPVCAVTHYAKVKRIVPHGADGKFRLEFDGDPVALRPIPFADAPAGTLQGPRYTTLSRLRGATRLAEAFAGSLARRVGPAAGPRALRAGFGGG